MTLALMTVKQEVNNFKSPVVVQELEFAMNQSLYGLASALNDFGNRWCKRERVECNAMKEWKLSIFNIVDKGIKSNRKAINRNWSNQKANPTLKTKAGNK